VGHSNDEHTIDFADRPVGSVDVAARWVTTVDDIEPADLVIVATEATQNAAVATLMR
jgi:hypothetical protein